MPCHAKAFAQPSVNNKTVLLVSHWLMCPCHPYADMECWQHVSQCETCRNNQGGFVRNRFDIPITYKKFEICNWNVKLIPHETSLILLANNATRWHIHFSMSWHTFFQMRLSWNIIQQCEIGRALYTSKGSFENMWNSDHRCCIDNEIQLI